MLSAKSKDIFDKMFSMMTESEIELIPRIVMVKKDDKKWRETITKAISLDEGIFKGNEFIITCKRCLRNDEIQFKGSLSLSIHNILASVNPKDNMIIKIDNVVSKFISGKKVQRSLVLMYLVIHE